MQVYTLVEATEQFCLHQFNDAKKHFFHYLAMARLVWQQLFLRTLWATRTEWVAPKGRVVFFPGGMTAFLGLYQEVDGLFVEVLPADGVVSRVEKRGACPTGRDCGGLCDVPRTSSFTTLDVPIDGVTYQRKQWVDRREGMILRWTVTPTKVYGADGEGVVTMMTTEEVVDSLELLPCGCVSATTENTVKLARAGFAVDCRLLKKKETALRWRFTACGTGVELVGEGPLAPCYAVHHQVGEAAHNAPVPEGCLDALLLGIQYRSSMVNPRASLGKRKEDRLAFEAASRKIVQDLNPIDGPFLERLAAQQVKW